MNLRLQLLLRDRIDEFLDENSDALSEGSVGSLGRYVSDEMMRAAVAVYQSSEDAARATYDYYEDEFS